MRSPLSDKTIFITGSGGVLGTAYVNTLLENDAAVVASDLPGHRADAMKERCQYLHPRAGERYNPNPKKR